MSADNPTAAGPTRQLVVFRMADTEFGVDIRHVREVIRVPEMTRMPRTPSFVEGVINLRGRILPVLDLKKRFSLPPVEATPDTRVMIVEWRGQVIGFLVDRVHEVLRVPAASVSKPTDMILAVAGQYLEGIVEARERLLILLDLDRILDQEEIRGLTDLEFENRVSEAPSAPPEGPHAP
jgi:purine-binding chemotaxis protein CheW